MNTFEDMQDIWQSGRQKGKLPDAGSIIAEVKKQHRKMLGKSIIGVITLSLTAVFITILGFQFTFKYTTTYLGMAIVVLDTISGVIVNARLAIPARINADIQDSTAAYLDSLIRYRNRQKFIARWFFGFYFIILALGMALYLFEFASRNILFGIVTYILTFGWFAFAWFFLRKRAISKQEKRIDGMINRLESIKKGMEDA